MAGLMTARERRRAAGGRRVVPGYNPVFRQGVRVRKGRRDSGWRRNDDRGAGLGAGATSWSPGWVSGWGNAGKIGLAGGDAGGFFEGG